MQYKLMRFLFFFFLPLQLFAISFRELDQHLGEEIEIRGFLYQKEDLWILAPQPNLKSCCVGKGTYIVVEGDFEHSASTPLVR